MPEGDTLYRAAVRARGLLLHRLVTRCESSTVSVPASRLLGRRLTICKSIGKHLLMRFDEDVWLHTHLGMNGRWRFAHELNKVPTVNGPNRLLICSSGRTAWCFGAPTMELLSQFAYERHPILSTLGPDILDRTIPVETIGLSLRHSKGNPSIAVALLDQSRCAGIGNVYKSEALFITGLHPTQKLSSISDLQLFELISQVRKLMLRNLEPGRRTTRWPGRGQHWVYERSGQKCLRCDGKVARFMLGTASPRHICMFKMPATALRYAFHSTWFVWW